PTPPPPPQPPPFPSTTLFRSHAEPLLCAAWPHPEARHHLVEDQQRPVAVAQRAQRRVESGLGRDEARVADVRLHDDGNAGFIPPDRKSTRLNSSHVAISYAVF